MFLPNVDQCKGVCICTEYVLVRTILYVPNIPIRVVKISKREICMNMVLFCSGDLLK